MFKLSRALRLGCLPHCQVLDWSWQRRLYAVAHADVQGSIRDAFADIRNSLSLIDQGDRIRDAQRQAKVLEKDLEVSEHSNDVCRC